MVNRILIPSTVIGLSLICFAQAPEPPQFPKEYEIKNFPKIDHDRWVLLQKVHKDERITARQRFEVTLRLVLEMREKDRFNWENMRSESNWVGAISFLDGVYGTDFHRVWTTNNGPEKLHQLLISMGYYKKDRMSGAKRKFSENDKNIILDFSLKLYDSTPGAK